MSPEHLPPLNPLGTFCFSCFCQWGEWMNRALNSSETLFPLPLFNNILPDSLSTQGLHPSGFPKDSNWGITESQDKAVLFLPSIWAQIPSFMVSITWLGWVRSYSQLQMQARFLQWLSPCPVPEPPCSTHCSVSRHRCAKFVQGIKLCKCISNIHTIYICKIYSRFLWVLLFFWKMFRSKEFTEKK